MRGVRAQIRTLVDEIIPLDREEADHRLDVLGWLDGAAEIFRTAKPATPPKHLVAYCVLVDADRQEILLVDHREAERWLPTGGHVELDEHPADTARRELLEELCVAPRFHRAVGARPLMVTVTRTQGRSEPHTDVSLWFVFEGSSDAALAPDETEFAGSRWWRFNDVRENGTVEFDPNIPRFIDKLQACVA
jgi:8-oxo-dGTP diphosphatase